MKRELTLSKYVAIWCVPDTKQVDVFKVEAEGFEDAWKKAREYTKKRQFSELIVLTEAQFVGLMRKLKGFLGSFEG